MSAAKSYGIVSALAFVVLAAASVWMGGLNQDEGWYLYAAELAGEGRMPYRDFFFTQGPLMPAVYSLLRFSWHWAGLAGARAATCLIGLSGICLFALTARSLVPDRAKAAAFAAVFALLGCNLYHVYYLTIPKTYALASLFVALGTFLAVKALAPGGGMRSRSALFAASGFVFALAAGVRISMAAIPAAAFVALALDFRRRLLAAVWLAIGTVVGLCAAYGPSVMDPAAFDGLCAAQAYHAARGGRSIIFTVGSLSRLVRWYLPLFALCGVALFGLAWKGWDGEVDAAEEDNGFRRVALRMVTASFIAAVIAHATAPFPYEDYQVPVMGLLAVLAVVPLMKGAAVESPRHNLSLVMLLATGLSFGASFGSPLLEKWTTNGMDRFWVIQKGQTELSQLRDAAAKVEALDPGGKTLLTQDLYLAIETGRKVPDGLEMGPFSQLTDEEWQELLLSAPCPVAALSGYSFAIVPPECRERPFEDQMAFWEMLDVNYTRMAVIDAFGQGATPLIILRRRPPEAAGADGGADGNAGKGGVE